MAGNRAIEHRNRVLGWLLMPLALFMLVSLATYSVNDYPNSSLGPDEVLNAGGRAGALVASVLFLVWGYGAYAAPVLLVLWGWNRQRNADAIGAAVPTAAVAGVMLAGATLVYFLEGVPADARFEIGGAAGLRIAQVTSRALGPDGAVFANASLLVFSILAPVVYRFRRRRFRKRVAASASDAPKRRADSLP